MNTDKEKQIDGLIEAIKKCSCVYTDCEQECSQCSNEELYDDAINHIARTIYEADYRKQSEGEWEWFEEWSPSTTEHPRECDDYGWRCGNCETALEDMVGGYWDNPDEKPKLNYCPECGARMKGENNNG